MKSFVKVVFLLFAILTSSYSNAFERFDTTKFISEKQREAEQYIKENNVKGLAIALFTNNKVLWKKCFGESTYNKPVNDSTLFSLQSISKNFTALAVMFAVQDGLVDLDIPIKNYLESFKVNSCFEENPEEKITLRMMLSHTAGFTHEAPIGNNFDYRSSSNHEHLNSICSTWMKFPVGKSYSYSNIGFDLAAEIIERVSGMSFENYLKSKIFEPLGLKNTTINDNDVLANNNRTEGKKMWIEKNSHCKLPFFGAGAVYSDVNDLIKYVQFQMNFGRTNDSQYLERRYLQMMYTINKKDYGLGSVIIHHVDKESSLDTYFITHGGLGFGFGSTMIWFPEYGLGCVIIGNRQFDYFHFAKKVLLDFITNNKDIHKNRNLTEGYFPIFALEDDSNKKFSFSCANSKASDSINSKKIEGNYKVLYYGKELKWYGKILNSFGYKRKRVQIFLENDKFCMKGYFGDSELVEYGPGLYFSVNGEALDFRNQYPTFRNVKLEKCN